MTENLNIKYMQRMLNLAIYSNEVTLVSIDGMIHNTQKEHSSLFNLFSNDFFQTVYQQLNEKKETNKLYIEDLKVLHKEFNLRIKNLGNTHLSDEEKKYEDTLISAISEISMLVNKLEIKIKNLFEKLGEKNENAK